MNESEKLKLNLSGLKNNLQELSTMMQSKGNALLLDLLSNHSEYQHILEMTEKESVSAEEKEFLKSETAKIYERISMPYLEYHIDELKSQYSREYSYKPKEDEFDTLSNKETQKIPKGVRIVEATSWRLGKDAVVKKGVISIYAFPNGYIDEASVVLSEATTRNTQRFKVSTKSLTGRINTEVINEKN